jgi:flagellar hook-associated protein 3 FlgL
MTVTNVSTFGSVQTLIQNMSQVQNELNTAEVQISSGKVSQTFDGMGGDVEQFTALNTQVAQLQNFQQGNSVYLSQLNTSNTVLGQIQSIATSVQSLLANQVSGGASNASFTQQLQAQLTALSGELNTSYQGQYIFGGTQTDTPPVITPVPAPQQIGVPDSSYYQGSAQDTTTRVSESQTVTNSIRADNPAFQQLFAGILQGLQPGASTSDLQNAETLVNNGLQGVIALQAAVNANTLNVQQVDTQSQSLQTYYQGLTQNMSTSDPVSLSTQVAQDQSILEAAFSAFSRISSLTLSNYLK